MNTTIQCTVGYDEHYHTVYNVQRSNDDDRPSFNHVLYVATFAVLL